MLNEETRRKLRLMNIGEFIDAIEEQQQDPQTIALPFEERFQQLTDSVYQQKYNDKVHRLIKAAKLRLPKADIHDILYTDNRPLNRGTMAELSSCRFVDDCRSIVLQGYTSSGKTFLGCALAKEACRQLHKVRYIRLPDLLSEYADKSLVPGGKAKVLTNMQLSRFLSWMNGSFRIYLKRTLGSFLNFQNAALIQHLQSSARFTGKRIG